MSALLYHSHSSLQRPQRIFLFALFLFASFLFARETSAAGVSLRINAATVQKGFTITDTENAARLALWPGSVTDPVSIRLEPSTILPTPLPTNATLVSDAWVFDVLKTNIVAKDPIVLTKALTIGLRYNSATLYQKRIYYWDGNKGAWLPLPSSTDAQGYARAMIRLPYAIVAVFEETSGVEGKASWFRHRFADTAASNDFPMGSRLRVTNIADGKSVDVVVRSTGPFVPGRVIDLASTAFEKIYPLWRGVTFVRVKLLP